MKKPFALFPMSSSSGPSKRMKMPMQDQKAECEWLWEATGSCPEQSLGIAVLQRAVLDLITPGVDVRDKDDAEKWISGSFGDQFESEYALSFSRIVQGFTDVSVNEFRTKILAFIDKARLSKESADGFRFQRN